MVVITVVGTVGFGVSRIAISSLRNQNRLEDSANAYQAATAGIEDGLLRWRFNKDTEVPAPGSGIGCESSPHEQSEFYTRVNLSTGEVTKCIKPNEAVSPRSNDIVYDLKISFKKAPGEAEHVKSTPTSSGRPIPALRKDETVEYNIGNITAVNSDVLLGLQQESGIAGVDDLLEAFFLNEKGEIVEKFNLRQNEIRRHTITTPRSFDVGDVTRKDIKTLRFKYLGQDLAEYRLVPPNALDEGGKSLAIDGRESHIDAIGYFGVAKRKLRLNLDRFSGSTLSLFDFLLYSSGDGDITPP